MLLEASLKMWIEILIGLIAILLLLLFGILLAILILGDEDRLDLLSIAFPLGSGVYTWFLFLISWMGIRLTAFTLLTTGILLLLITSILLVVKRKWSNASPQKRKFRHFDRVQLSTLFAGVVFAVFVVFAVVIAVGRSYSSWDAMAIWSVKGYGIARGETIFAGANWGEFGLNYPLNTPLLIATFEILGVDQLPGSKTIFPLLYSSLILGFFVFLTRRRLRVPFAGLGALFIATTPLIFEHGTIGYANLPFGVFLALGVFHAIRGFLDGDRRRQIVSGILLALAGWTRPEGVLIVPIVIVALFLALKISRRGEIHWRYWLMPIVIIVGPWLVFARLYSEDSLLLTAAKEALTAIGDGHLRLDSFYLTARYMLRQLLTPPIWGVLFPVALILLVLNLSKLRPREYPDIFASLFAAGAVTLSTVFHFYFVAFLGTLTSWLPTSANRMFLPAAILLASWIFLLAGKDHQQEEASIIQADSTSA